MLFTFQLTGSRSEMERMPRVSKTRSVAHRIRQRITRSSERFWRVDDFEGDPGAVNSALSRLAADGELERVRRGLYWRGRLTRFGRTLASPVGAVRAAMGSEVAVGAAETYAANLLGLSTQVSPVPVIALTRRAPTGLAGVRLVNRASRSARREARLNEMEVTVLEALDGWDRYVEVDAATAVERLARVLDGEDVRVGRLVSASRTEPSAVRERLRWLLERTGHADEIRRIEPARDRATRDAALAVIGARY